MQASKQASKQHFTKYLDKVSYTVKEGSLEFNIRRCCKKHTYLILHVPQKLLNIISIRDGFYCIKLRSSEVPRDAENSPTRYILDGVLFKCTTFQFPIRVALQM